MKRTGRYSSGTGYYYRLGCSKKRKNTFFPQDHQKLVMNYFVNDLRFKGLILYHRLGSGKTCTSILACDEMLKQSKVKRIYVISPGTLRPDWIREYCEVCGVDPDVIKKNYTFITYNYSGIVKNRNFTKYNFNNSVVIIDEVHGLISGVRNNTKNKTAIYKKIMKSNCKVLALSGTPIYSDISEFAILMHLVNPKTQFPDLLKCREKLGVGKLANEDFAIAFKDMFTYGDSGEVTGVKIPRLFEKEVCGTISYFPGKKGKDYPEKILMPPIRCLMSVEHEHKYFFDYQSEQNSKNPPPIKLKRSNPALYELLTDLHMMYLKRMRSRSSSNFYYPPRFENFFDGKIYYADGPASKKPKQKKSNVKMSSDNAEDIEMEEEKHTKKKEIVNWVKLKYFNNKLLATKYSSKFTALIFNILRFPNQKHMVFTTFVRKGGIELLNTLFKLCGVTPYLYYGSISTADREKNVKEFNKPIRKIPVKKKKHIKVILVSEAGAAGITLKGVNHIHILESSTKETITQQAIGRGIRYKSHEGLPANLRWTKVWRYWSTASLEPINIKVINNYEKEPVEKEITITNKMCIDEILYKKGMMDMVLINSFLKIVQYSSIESIMERNKGEMVCEENDFLKQLPKR
jgi:superfamily II DNA or RNA helicase